MAAMPIYGKNPTTFLLSSDSGPGELRCPLGYLSLIFMVHYFSKTRPHIEVVDDIAFRKPVEVGSLLFLSSQVSWYTSVLNPINISVQYVGILKAMKIIVISGGRFMKYCDSFRAVLRSN